MIGLFGGNNDSKTGFGFSCSAVGPLFCLGFWSFVRLGLRRGFLVHTRQWMGCISLKLFIPMKQATTRTPNCNSNILSKKIDWESYVNFKERQNQSTVGKMLKLEDVEEVLHFIQQNWWIIHVKIDIFPMQNVRCCNMFGGDLLCPPISTKNSEEVPFVFVDLR